MSIEDDEQRKQVLGELGLQEAVAEPEPEPEPHPPVETKPPPVLVNPINGAIHWTEPAYVPDELAGLQDPSPCPAEPEPSPVRRVESIRAPTDAHNTDFYMRLLRSEYLHQLKVDRQLQFTGSQARNWVRCRMQDEFTEQDLFPMAQNRQRWESRLTHALKQLTLYGTLLKQPGKTRTYFIPERDVLNVSHLNPK